MAGCTDGPLAHPFNTFQRLSYLRAKQVEWKDLDNLEVIQTIPFQTPCVQWLLQASVLVRALNTQNIRPSCFDTIHTLHLRSTADDLPEKTLYLGAAFSEMEIDARQSQDLLVIFNRLLYPPEYVEINQSAIFANVFTIVLLQKFTSSHYEQDSHIRQPTTQPSRYLLYH